MIRNQGAIFLSIFGIGSKYKLKIKWKLNIIL